MTDKKNLIALLKALEVQDIEKLLQCDEEVFEAIGLEIAGAIKRLKTEKAKAIEWTGIVEKEVVNLVQVNNRLQADLAQSQRDICEACVAPRGKECSNCKFRAFTAKAAAEGKDGD